MTNVWKNKDESWNFYQDYDPEMIKEEKRKELESEIRVQTRPQKQFGVFQANPYVHEMLQLQKNKRKKGKKGKMGKKDKDLTADRTIESLYKELVEEGLLIQALKVNLSDYIGEYSYLGTTLRQVSIEPMPSLLDVRQLVTLYGVLPLGKGPTCPVAPFLEAGVSASVFLRVLNGLTLPTENSEGGSFRWDSSAAVHKKAPLVKSLLLAGPSGVGKKMLVHAICTETGANLFNLSATNIAGKYPGNSGLQMMLHVVFKVARQLQPSVVWIGDAEKTFYKKVPNSERESALLAGTQPVGTQERSCSGLPAGGSPGSSALGVVACDCLVKRDPVSASKATTQTRLQIIQRNKGVITDALSVSCLAKISDGFTQGHIVQVVKEVLTERRIRQQARKPLTAVEFITALTSMSPVYQEEEESFKVWYAKTPMGRKRALALTGGADGGGPWSSSPQASGSSLGSSRHGEQQTGQMSPQVLWVPGSMFTVCTERAHRANIRFLLLTGVAGDPSCGRKD
ncbi:hypothetical protein CB1_000327018 [Camelus ferus]|nr:hypothetical protein CB1_000327018 [Camelus ferus]